MSYLESLKQRPHYQAPPPPQPSHICSNCGNPGFPKTIYNGAFWIEIILWCCFILPGIIYSCYRLATKYKGCPSCKAPNMILINSPKGQVLYSEINKK